MKDPTCAGVKNFALVGAVLVLAAACTREREPPPRATPAANAPDAPVAPTASDASVAPTASDAATAKTNACAEAIASLPRGEPDAALTAAERHDVAALAADTLTVDAHERLARAVVLAPRVALTTALASLVGAPRKRVANAARDLLELRFAAAIDGAYVDALDAVYLVDLDAARPVTREGAAADRIAEHLKRRASAPIRACIVEWARRHAALPHDFAHGKTLHPIVWRILLDNGELREGAPLSEWTSLLGEPTSQSASEAAWDVGGWMHVNPLLYATLDGGVVTEARVLSH